MGENTCLRKGKGGRRRVEYGEGGEGGRAKVRESFTSEGRCKRNKRITHHMGEDEPEKVSEREGERMGVRL